MVITDIRVRRLSHEGKLRAILSLTFDDALAVHDIKVIEGQQGLFVSMPSKRAATGEYRDIVHPINQQMRQMIEQKALHAYRISLLQHRLHRVRPAPDMPGQEDPPLQGIGT